MQYRHRILSVLVAAGVGLFSSLVAALISGSTLLTAFSILFLLLAAVSFYFVWPTFGLIRTVFGIRRLDNDPSVYLLEMSHSVARMEKAFRYKGLTGHEFFTSKLIRQSFKEAKLHLLKRFVCIFTDPQSNSYKTERSSLPNRSSLHQKHQVAMDYFETVISEIRARNQGVNVDVRYYDENKNMLNMVIVDDCAFLFFRGFPLVPVLGNQIIFKVELSRCCPSVRALVLSVFDENFAVFSRCVSGTEK